MTETINPRDVHLLTTDALLADLVAGRAIAIEDNKLFSLASEDSRAVLDWYRRNRTKWAGNLSGGDTEAIIDSIGRPIAAVATPVDDGAVHSGKTLRLAKVVAYRFAGLHAFGRPTEPPDFFIFEPAKAVTLFEGVNGSGKTSIANAIVWCLSGYLIRPQRAPEEGPTEFECEIARAGGVTTKHMMSAVTPMPIPDGDWLPASGTILADTWVELTFVDQDGALLPPVRRQQTRTSRGKLTEVEPDLNSLGLDPISWRIATTMPALLPFLAIGSASQLGQAVARLTGLADLVDLAKHAKKASDRIATRTIKDHESELAEISNLFDQASGDLNKTVVENASIAFEGTTPAIDSQECEDRLRAITTHFTELKATGLAEARSVLGAAFDPDDKAKRDNLEASIHPAIAQLTQVLQLPSIARLSALALDANGVVTVATLLNVITSEAQTLADLAANPSRARREQLYARISSWMHDHDHPDDGTCVVCGTAWDAARDPVTGKPISDHLSAAKRDREIISRTIADWASHWCGRLLSDLPPQIAAESRRDLPSAPADLLRSGFNEELFETESFRGVLLALRDDAKSLVDERSTALPSFSESQAPQLPDILGPAVSVLQEMLRRVTRALAFAAWREGNANALRDFLHAVRRGVDEAADADRAIGRRLSKLLAIVEGVAPLNAALELVGRMKDVRTKYSAKQTRIENCGRAAVALELLVPLGDLAQTQVETLRSKLHRRSEYWRKAMYRNATEFAPDLTGTDMDAKGVLELKAGRQGVAAPARHISNASALRGALLGFFLAFREHVLTTRGGLALLVLDDPQELLDNDNRERLARGLAILSAAGAQLLVTTHDRKFARSLISENRAQDAVEHLSVHPVNSVRPTLLVSPAIEEVDRKRQEFRANPDSARHAQDYASDLRVFLESRLGDLFDDLAHPAYASQTKALTLFPLMDKLRGSVLGGGSELFLNPVVKRFAGDAALAEGAEPRRVLNQAHHDKASITYIDVKNVDADFTRLRSSIEKVHEQYRLHRWREPLISDDGGSAVVPLRTIVRPTFSVPVLPDIAAFVRHSAEAGSQSEADERLDGGWFEGKALYFVRGDTLGFAIPGGSVAIVEAEPYPGRDQNLVIGRYRDQVFARRLVISSGSIGMSLATQMPDPRKSRPTLTFDASKLKIHRIVGVVFTNMSPPVGGGEASPVDAVPELAKISIAYRVVEESAVPLALPRQILLGGPALTASDLDGWEGRLAAVTLDDGSSIFKRVGPRLPGKLGYLRQFETIGGLGSSLVIATEVVDGAPAVPTMASARQVVGVLYE
jgi:hypothetical protein